MCAWHARPNVGNAPSAVTAATGQKIPHQLDTWSTDLTNKFGDVNGMHEFQDRTDGKACVNAGDSV
jgi:hypothetical protein